MRRSLYEALKKSRFEEETPEWDQPESGTRPDEDLEFDLDLDEEEDGL